MPAGVSGYKSGGGVRPAGGSAYRIGGGGGGGRARFGVQPNPRLGQGAYRKQPWGGGGGRADDMLRFLPDSQYGRGPSQMQPWNPYTMLGPRRPGGGPPMQYQQMNQIQDLLGQRMAARQGQADMMQRMMQRQALRRMQQAAMARLMTGGRYTY